MRSGGRESGRGERTRSAILVASPPGQLSVAELERLATAGERPRKDYVELARLLDADVIDSHFMAERASPLARNVATLGGTAAGQVAEAFVHRARYRHICAWADRLGIPLALLCKLARSRDDLVLVSVWLSGWKKAPFFRYANVHSHVRAIVNYGSVQMRFAAEALGVATEKLHVLLQPVDERFWRAEGEATDDVICSAGWEARDYRTLAAAVRGLAVHVELALGTVGARRLPSGVIDLPANVTARELAPKELRSLYSRSRFVVVPLHDVDYDAGVTTLTEAMAMGKAVIVSRTRGQVDIVREGKQGLYVPPGDPAALRSAVEHLLRNPDEAARMGRAGRALVEERHTLDAYVRRLAAIIEEGTSGRARD